MLLVRYTGFTPGDKFQTPDAGSLRPACFSVTLKTVLGRGKPRRAVPPGMGGFHLPGRSCTLLQDKAPPFSGTRPAEFPGGLQEIPLGHTPRDPPPPPPGPTSASRCPARQAWAAALLALLSAEMGDQPPPLLNISCSDGGNEVGEDLNC